MSRDWHLYLDDLISCCRLIIEFTEGLNREEFLADARTYQATLRQIELVGEAVKAIPVEHLARFPDMPWREMIAARNILAHVYFAVDDGIIWQIVSEEIAPLLNTAELMRESGQ